MLEEILKNTTCITYDDSSCGEEYDDFIEFLQTNYPQMETRHQLNQIGSDAGIYDSLGNLIDDSQEILNDLWLEYCNS